jgi:UPF0755 protein
MKRFLIAIALLLVVAAAVAAVYGLQLADRIREPYKGFDAPEQLVEIPRGAGAADIRRRLVEAGVVSDELAFRAALAWTGRARALQAGEYRFDRPLSVLEVIDKLARGEIYAHPITFPEGLTIREMGVVYEARGFGTASEFVAAAQSGDLIRDLDPAARDLEGYLFPETYGVARGTPATSLVAMMVDRFRDHYQQLASQAPARPGLPLRQLVTLASLVEKETAQASERPIVSAVYHNRLTKKMPLQCDPTVVYALMRAGRWTGNIRRADLQIKSPYNTYVNPGLPPGPIAAPGRAAIEAAIRPAAVPYLYFVSRNDGTHVFAETLAEHNRNVAEWQIKYFKNH